MTIGKKLVVSFLALIVLVLITYHLFLTFGITEIYAAGLVLVIIGIGIACSFF